MSVFPDVPIAPGVPTLLRAASVNTDILNFLTSDFTQSYASDSNSTQWGIFQNGVPVIVADSVVSLGYKQEWTISDYPLENGAFQSYDKVQTPFRIRVGYTTGGSTADRAAFLNSIAAIAGNTQLYDVYTPEGIHSSVNVTKYEYNRTSVDGVGLLMVIIECEEIRVAGNSAITQSGSVSNPTNSFAFKNAQPLAFAQQPSAVDPVTTGQVQPTAPSSFQLNQIPIVTYQPHL